MPETPEDTQKEAPAFHAVLCCLDLQLGMEKAAMQAQQMDAEWSRSCWSCDSKQAHFITSIACANTFKYNCSQRRWMQMQGSPGEMEPRRSNELPRVPLSRAVHGALKVKGQCRQSAKSALPVQLAFLLSFRSSFGLAKMPMKSRKRNQWSLVSCPGTTVAVTRHGYHSWPIPILP